MSLNIVDLLIVILAIGTIIALYVSKHFRRKVTPADKELPVLITAMFMARQPMLIADGYTKNNLRFSYVTDLGQDAGDVTSGYGLYTIELPFESAAHVVGISKSHGISVKIDEQNTALQPLHLEGNYPNYFSVYVDSGEQSRGRYVLDPKAMVFTIDFCRKFHWEILGSNLYFLSRSVIPDMELVDRFISKIRPAIDRGMPPKHTAYDMPYVSLRPKNMDCPLCQSRLVNEADHLRCPNGHGMLLTGKQLLDLRQKSDPTVLNQQGANSTDVPRDRVLTCPNCHHEMKQSKYQGSSVTVDICGACQYRWLDAQEAFGIAGVKAA